MGQLPLDPPRPPMVGGDVWETVMIRAGYRCQCSRCPACRRLLDGCPREAGPTVRLVVGPLDPGPDPLRRPRSVPVADLLAWCPKCWDDNVKTTRKFYARLAQREAEDRADTLF